MDDKQLADLLRVKRAREQRANARAAEALLAQQEAHSAQADADRVRARHAAERPRQEADAYARLLDGPVASHRVQSETALLSGLVAISGLLTAQCKAATAATGECEAISQQARRAQADAMRGTEAALAIRRAVSGVAAQQADRASELEQEDIGPALAARQR